MRPKRLYDLAALADTCTVAVPVPFACAVREYDARRLTGVDHVFDLQVRDVPFDDYLGRQAMAVGNIGRLDARHRRALDDVGRMRQRAPDHGFLDAIGGKDRPLLDIDLLRVKGRFKLADQGPTPFDALDGHAPRLGGR